MISYFLDWIKNLKKVEKITDKDLSNAFKKKLKALEDLLNFKINSTEYFVKALTHRSYLEVASNLKKSNERLEFLGDSVLGLIVAEHFFKKYDKKGEGHLTKARAKLVNKDMLVEGANLIGLKNLVLYDKRYIGESQKGVNTIIADAFEALIGAIYLDQGLDEARNFINNFLINPFVDTDKFVKDKNYKGQLLELAHLLKLDPPVYKMVSEQGPEHEKEFTIELFFSEKLTATGVGKNKKAAEQNAAKKALNILNNNLKK